MVRSILFVFLACLVGHRTLSQTTCLSFTGHPFGSCALGNIALSTCPPGIDFVVWSNGWQGMWVQDLPIGDHSYQAYDNGLVVAADTLQVQQLEWSIVFVMAYPQGGGYVISGWAQVPWCNTSAFNTPCCIPDPALTYVRLVQDGVTEMTTAPCINCDMVTCSGTTFMFWNVPGGHTYQVRLYDPTCGQVITDTTTVEVPLSTGINAFGDGSKDAVIVSNGETLMIADATAAGNIGFFDGLGRRIDLPMSAPGTYLLGQLSPGCYFARMGTSTAMRTHRFLR